MDPIEISAIAMKNDLRKLDNISHNVANLTTPAYKKSVSITESFAAQLQHLNKSLNGQQVAGDSITLPMVKILSDHSAGAVKESGNPFDLALEGDAYFELASPEGTFYTRRGNFDLDSSGRMRLSGTNAVLNGLSGDIRVGTNPEIDSLGGIFENGNQIAQLKLVHFADKNQLLPVGNGLFSAKTASSKEIAYQTIVRQGYLETSNTQPAEEMLNLVSLARHMEATQQVIQGYDTMLETALDDLGNF